MEDTSRVRGQSVRYGSTARVFLGAHRSSALSIEPPLECQLVFKTLDKTLAHIKKGSAKPRRLRRITTDKVNDSRRLWEEMVHRDIELIAPHRCILKARYQDGRKLHKYCRTWIVECTFAWLFNFRRISFRYEREVRFFAAVIYLVFMFIVLIPSLQMRDGACYYDAKHVN